MADFSCYITIDNNTPYTLTLADKGASYGYWKTEPPSTIPPFSVTSQFQLSDSTGLAGATGYVKYKADSPNEDSFLMNFDDPYTGSNSCSIENPNRNQFGVCFTAQASDVTNNNKCPTSGHPLIVTFYITSFV